nr:MAG TPA: CW7 repeat protein [Caudoviricetes sp.]
MMVTVGSARIDERGNANWGKAGDQNSREVATEPYYKHRLGWYMLRPKEAAVANKLAQAMREGCDNDNIGYSQSDRYGVLNNLKIYGSIAKIKAKTNADCSSLVRACCVQAGINVGDFNTSSEVAVLEKTGAFNKAVVVANDTKLCAGDILVTRTKGHTVVVTEGYPREDGKPTVKPKPDKAAGKAKKSIEEVASEIIAGKWGNNPERKEKLIKAGYVPAEVQTVVNKLLK